MIAYDALNVKARRKNTKSINDANNQQLSETTIEIYTFENEVKRRNISPQNTRANRVHIQK